MFDLENSHNTEMEKEIKIIQKLLTDRNNCACVSKSMLIF